MNKHTVYEVWCWNEKNGTFHNATNDPAHGNRGHSVRSLGRARSLAGTSAGFSGYGNSFNGDHFMVVARNPDGTRHCVMEVESMAVILRDAVKVANEARV